MDDLLREVLDLQKSWSAQNTPQMQRRGRIIRTELAALLRIHSRELADAVGIPEPDLGVQGRDGTGLKTEVPWTRVFSRERSPSATIGWYVVYLFSARGDRVYLSLNQGTTVWKSGEFVPRKPQELRARVDWARPIIREQLETRQDLVRKIRLDAQKTRLGSGYEAGNVVSIEYNHLSIPGKDELIQDLIFMTGLLGSLYRAEESGAYIPGDLSPEIAEAQEVAASTAGRRTRQPKIQGFRLTAQEKRAVELRGVQVATDFFRSQGWSVKDVGDKESYDLLLARGPERLHVEVKGTTSAGAQVVLTRAEVEKQRRFAPNNALVVVHSIKLDREPGPPVASGGILHYVSPWEISDDDLTVVSYFYRTGL
ncbi:MrcB family domain-containing protein [Nonomuraea fuscirosea]|uniref:MrcB family domain-containing protein n=1 Tax=Nonomuraea fuscirosea TaxID=1291556 RepID=UPI0034222F63